MTSYLFASEAKGHATATHHRHGLHFLALVVFFRCQRVNRTHFHSWDPSPIKIPGEFTQDFLSLRTSIRKSRRIGKLLIFF